MNVRVKRAERGLQDQQSRFLGHVSRCHPVQLQRQSRVLRNKRQSPGAVVYDGEGWVLREGFGTQDLEANTELRH